MQGATFRPSIADSLPRGPRRRVLGRLALLGLLLAGCAGPAPEPPAQDAATAEGEGEAVLRILVFRGGRAAGLGHNHVLLVPRAHVTWGEAGPRLQFRLDELQLDPPALREQLGPAFASRLDEAAVAATRANMLRSLEAAQHPEVTVSTLQQVGEGRSRAVEVEIALHGQRRRQWLAVTVDGAHAEGRAVVRQSDFGLQPFSVLGGLLSVRDELVVEFRLDRPKDV